MSLVHEHVLFAQFFRLVNYILINRQCIHLKTMIYVFMTKKCKQWILNSIMEDQNNFHRIYNCMDVFVY